MRTVFVDIDTQIDFMFPAGALYVPGAEMLLPVFSKLNRYAAAHGIPVVATTDAHLENDPEFREWPPHCVCGTAGQQKASQTLLEPRITVPMGPANYQTAGAAQIIVEKRHIDVFEESNLADVIERLRADRFVVYGLVTEYCVRTAALGLLSMGKPVEIVTDAIRAISDDRRDETFREFTKAGGTLTTVHAITE